MNQLIDEIIKKLKEKYNLPSIELERIVDSQFKCLENNIRARGKQSVKMIHLGKFKPSKFFLDNYDKLHKFKTNEEYEAHVKIIRDRKRLEKLAIKEAGKSE